MAIHFNCTCGKRLQIDEKNAGKKVRCPACSSVVAAPATVETAVQEVRPVPPPLPRPSVVVLDRAEEEIDDHEEVEPRERERPRRSRKRPRDAVPTADDIPNHNGEELPVDAVFFAPPPPEIGRLLSGYTSLREGKRPISSGARTAWVLGSTSAGLLLSILLMFIEPALLLLVFLFAPVGFLISFLATRFAPACSFVGQEGIARLKCNRALEPVNEDVFVFEDADELRTSQTRHYVNGIYTGTHYNFDWTDADKRRVYSIRGTYHSEGGTPKASDPYYFAVAAEMAWSEHLLERHRQKLADGGSMKFALRGNDWVRIGPGLLVLNRRGDKIDFEGDDIDRVRISQGVVAILEPGAKEGWFSSKGVYKFNYQDLANAQFFLFLMERLLGVRASG